MLFAQQLNLLLTFLGLKGKINELTLVLNYL